MSQFYFALDVRDDPMLIQEYESWLKADAIWPSVIHCSATVARRNWSFTVAGTEKLNESVSFSCRP